MAAKRKPTAEDVALAQTIYKDDLDAIAKYLRCSVAEVKSLLPKAEAPKVERSKDGLTDKQRKFINEYLVDLNATQAAIRAGYSPDTAKQMGCENLAKPDLALEIEKRQRRLAERTQVSAERVIKEFARIAFSDMRTFTTWGPDGVSLKDADELDDDDAACVAEVSQTISKDGGSIKFKVHNKTDALTQLGRHLGLFIDKVEHDFTGLSDEQRLEAVLALVDRARARQAGQTPQTDSE